jgi:hypothetical protein
MMAAVARSTEIKALLLPFLLVGVAACGGPSKTQALEAIQRDVKEDGSCTLPVDVLGKLKKQFASKAICVPLAGADKAGACVDALVAAGVTRAMPTSYMVDWTDEAAMPGVSPYDKKARNLVFKSCVEMTGPLRDGRFSCAEAKAEKVVEISKVDDKTVSVRYARTLTNKPSLAAVSVACGAVTPPPAEATVTLAKDSAGWTLAAAPAESAGH